MAGNAIVEFVEQWLGVARGDARVYSDNQFIVSTVCYYGHNTIDYYLITFKT